MAPKPTTSITAMVTAIASGTPGEAAWKASNEKDPLAAPSSRTAASSATAPASSSPSMNSTGRPASPDSLSLRIIAAPPRLMISQAMRNPAALRIPNTPNAPMRLVATPNSQPASLLRTGVDSQQAMTAGTRPSPKSHRASPDN